MLQTIKKNCENRLGLGNSAPRPPLASGGWGLFNLVSKNLDPLTLINRLLVFGTCESKVVEVIFICRVDPIFE